jgi:para-nitrobenzyl esterase
VADGRLGAFHALDLPFVFLALDERAMVGEEPPRPMAEGMHAAWAELARTGGVSHLGPAPWDRYDTATQKLMSIDREPITLPAPELPLAGAWAQALRFR